MPKETTLTKAALKLGVGYIVAMRLMLTGKLGPASQTPKGRWVLTEEGVDEYKRSIGG